MILIIGKGIVAGIICFCLHHKLYLYICIGSKEGAPQYAQADREVTTTIAFLVREVEIAVEDLVKLVCHEIVVWSARGY